MSDVLDLSAVSIAEVIRAQVQLHEAIKKLLEGRVTDAEMPIAGFSNHVDGPGSGSGSGSRD